MADILSQAHGSGNENPLAEKAWTQHQAIHKGALKIFVIEQEASVLLYPGDF